MTFHMHKWRVTDIQMTWYDVARGYYEFVTDEICKTCGEVRLKGRLGLFLLFKLARDAYRDEQYAPLADRLLGQMNDDIKSVADD